MTRAHEKHEKPCKLDLHAAIRCRTAVHNDEEEKEEAAAAAPAILVTIIASCTGCQISGASSSVPSYFIKELRCVV